MKFSLCIIGLLALGSMQGCQAKLVLGVEQGYLQQELEKLPKKRTINGRATFHSRDFPAHALSKGRSSEIAPLSFVVMYPSEEMLQVAGDAILSKRFSSKSEDDDVFALHGKIIDLKYDDYTDIGISRAVIEVVISVNAIQNSIVRCGGKYFSGKQMGERFKQGWLVGVGERYRMHYTRVVFRAIMVALDAAIDDIKEKCTTPKGVGKTMGSASVGWPKPTPNQ